jgi:hypothetical protein
MLSVFKTSLIAIFHQLTFYTDVEGLMHGEIMDDIKSGKRKLEEFHMI